MKEIATKEVSGKDGMYTVSLCVDKLDEPDSVPLTTRGKHDRKYNIKVRQEDLILLDALASKNTIPRSVLLNKLLHEILLDELRSIQEYDVRLLLAKEADSRAQYDGLSSPWVLDALHEPFNEIVENITDYNQVAFYVQEDPDDPGNHHSKDYAAVKNVLERMEK